MNLPIIKYCPGTLKKGFDTYCKKSLTDCFFGKKVSHLLPFNSPLILGLNHFFEENALLSISGVQEKFSIILDGKYLRLAKKNEIGTHILKPIPNFGLRADQIPANEHLTMQIAQQVFKIKVAANALIFFNDGTPAYITKRFDFDENGNKLAQEDFASLAQKTPQTHGEHYKYSGNYSDLFELLKKNVPAYKTESPKLLKLIMFNYLFSNGDAHLKNFSIIETPMGDFKLSPAYDLLNTSIHIKDNVFALEKGLLPPNLSKGKMREQFKILANMAEINDITFNKIFSFMTQNSTEISALLEASFLNEKTKNNYLQSYQKRLKLLLK